MASSCGECGNGPDNCHGECYWMEESQVCVPISLACKIFLPFAFHFYIFMFSRGGSWDLWDHCWKWMGWQETLDSGWRVSIVQISQDDGFLIYKHTGIIQYRYYLLNVTNSWIVVEKIYGKDLWDGDVLLRRPIKRRSLIAPKDGWYFSYDAADGKHYVLDSNIKVCHESFISFHFIETFLTRENIVLVVGGYFLFSYLFYWLQLRSFVLRN